MTPTISLLSLQQKSIIFNLSSNSEKSNTRKEFLIQYLVQSTHTCKRPDFKSKGPYTPGATLLGEQFAFLVYTQRTHNFSTLAL